MTVTLEARLRSRRDAGAKLLVPYLTGGLDDDWVDVLGAVADAGADAVEIGIPFSDPVMDGPVIQQASQQALATGRDAALGHRRGVEVRRRRAARGDDLRQPRRAHGIPALRGRARRRRHRRRRSCPTSRSTSSARGPRRPTPTGSRPCCSPRPPPPTTACAPICARSRGFVYAVSLLGVTGERDTLAARGAELADRCRAVTDLPVLLGVGISNAERRGRGLRARRRRRRSAARSCGACSTAAGPTPRASSWPRSAPRSTHAGLRAPTLDQVPRLEAPARAGARCHVRRSRARAPRSTSSRARRGSRRRSSAAARTSRRSTPPGTPRCSRAATSRPTARASTLATSSTRCSPTSTRCRRRRGTSPRRSACSRGSCSRTTALASTPSATRSHGTTRGRRSSRSCSPASSRPPTGSTPRPACRWPT